MTVKEVESQIQQARQSLQQERENIAERRKELIKAEKQRKEAKEKLPTPTARTLRSGLFAGLEGRKRRRQVEKVKKDISTDVKKIGLLKGELTKREKEELKPFEQQIEQKEKEVEEYKKAKSAYEKKITDYEIGRKFARKGVFPFGANKIVMEGYRDEKESLRGIEEFKKSLAQPKGIKESEIKQWGSYIDPSTGLGFCALPEDAKKEGWIPEAEYKLKKAIFSQPKFDFKQPRDLSRTDFIKEFAAPMKNVKLDKPKFDSQFRTTGSPIRMTKLTSFKSRGYIPVKKPEIVKPKKIIKPSLFKKDKKISIKETKFDDDLFFGKKSKKKSKKRSIWGF
jgi:hypothetical protein